MYFVWIALDLDKHKQKFEFKMIEKLQENQI